MNPIVQLTNAKRVMVFGAHADDEILGCGATIYTLAKKYGAEVTVVTFTNRAVTMATAETVDAAKTLTDQEMKAADDVLGVHRRIGLGIPNREVKHDGETIARCAKLIRDYKPEVVFMHQPHDQHTDHRAVSGAVGEAVWKAWEATRMGRPGTFDAPGAVPSGDWGPIHEVGLVLNYEIMLRRIAAPHFFVSFDEEALKAKGEAMKTQVSQADALRDILAHIEHRARDLGALMGNGTYAAEAFEVSNCHPLQIRL